MSLLNLESLYRDQEHRRKFNRKVYEQILKQCHRRIQLVNKKLKMFECYFKVPNYIFGYPAYNINDVCNYLCQRLIKNGLIAEQVDQGLIYISWDPEYIDFERYQKTANKTNLTIRTDIDLDMPSLFPSIKTTKGRTKKQTSEPPEHVALAQYDPLIDDLIPINTKKIAQRQPTKEQYPWN